MMSGIYIPLITPGTAELSICSTADFDTKIAVYASGSACPPVDGDLIACNEDGAGCDNFTSYTQFAVESGMSYLLRLGGWGNGAPGESGSGTFTARKFIPPNDNCADAIAIDSETVGLAFSNINATTDGPDQSGDCISGAGTTGEKLYNDIWYLYTPDYTGTAEFSTCSAADFDTKIAVYAPGSACPPLDENTIACNDDGSGCSTILPPILSLM